MKIKITVDSTNDLSPELIEKYNIGVLPLTVNMGDKLYRDMVDITPDDIYAHVNGGGALPKTSAVNAAEYGEMFEKYLKEYDAIIHINISSEMSTCHNSARMAAEGLPVYPIDSRNLSTGSALLALMACEKAAAGEDAEKIAEDLRAAVDKVDASFVVSRLDYLHKGGRCSAIAMLGANVLKLKPCIIVSDGQMSVGKKYRGNMNKVLPQYVADQLGTGESVDPEYQRFISGLNLSKIQILPHYQMVKDNLLDGKRLFEDITFGDSFGRSFYVLIDSSYVMRRDDLYTLWGEGYLIRDGQMKLICRKGEHIVITPEE